MAEEYDLPETSNIIPVVHHQWNLGERPLTSAADAKRNSQNDEHGEVDRESLDQSGDEHDEHCQKECESAPEPVRHPAEQIRAHELPRREDRLGQRHFGLDVVTYHVPLENRNAQGMN